MDINNLSGNPFVFEFEVIYSDGQRSSVPQAGRHPRAVIVGQYAVLLYDIKGCSIEDIARKCAEDIRVNGRCAAIVKEAFFRNGLAASQEGFNSLMEKIGGQKLQNRFYLTEGIEGAYFLFNPVTGQSRTLQEHGEIVCRPVLFLK